jgi:hypothetical protein
MQRFKKRSIGWKPATLWLEASAGFGIAFSANTEEVFVESEKIIEELKHLVRYHRQACHEFFEDTNGELEERRQIVWDWLDSGRTNLEEIKRVIELLITTQADLKKRIEGLEYLTQRMQELLR